MGIKSRCQQSWVPSGGSRENPFLIFSNFWRLPIFLDLWSHHSNLCFCCHISFSDSTLLTPSYKDPCDCVGPVQVIQDSLLISKSLITSAKSLLPSKVAVTCSRHLGPGHLWSVVWWWGQLFRVPYQLNMIITLVFSFLVFFNVHIFNLNVITLHIQFSSLFYVVFITII